MATSSHNMQVNAFGIDSPHWRNWVGNQSCVRAARGAPTSEDELCSLVRDATGRGLKVRAAGSGHSFTPVALTNGLHLTLSGMKGVRHVDRTGRRVTVSAGTTINELVRVLRQEGLSMVNQGDIDSQAIAGALTTGTHGTGAKLPALASAIVGMKLVQPDGAILVVDESTPDLLLAGRVSLGTLGVISEMTLQVADSYRLRERIWREDFEAAMDMHDDLAAEHRHFSFFWCMTEASRHCYCLPDTAATSRSGRTSDVCEMKVMDITEEEPFATEFEKVAYSSDVYPIEYIPNFHELEYAVPVEHGKDAVRAVRKLMIEEFPAAVYPIEYRFTAGDDAWMSPFHRQDSVTVSVSGQPGTDYWSYLRAVDRILRDYGARPHWGKLHFMTEERLAGLFPEFEQFREIRRELDPQGLFLNDHLRPLFA